VFTSSAANSVAENSTAVVTVAGADADSATGLTTTLTGADAALFSLTNGALAFKAAPNFEAPADAGKDNVYNVSINVVDASGNATTQNLAITVTNANEAPAVSSAATGTVAENAAITTAVYTAAATDVDAGDVMSYSLAGADAAAFAINAATGVVTLKASANFEAKSSYAIDVIATDKGGLTSTKAVTVTVTNVNEAPVVTSAATATVAENAVTSTVIYTATSSDVDAGDSATYSLGGTDAAAFNIDAATGAVTLKAAANFEAKSAYAIDVTATDKGGLTNTKAVAVAVTNVNEAPVVTSAPTATVAENAATSTVIYTATSSDVDAGDSATYSLGGADAAAFAIDAATGAVTLKASANYEAKSAYAIDVTATDKGGLTNTKAVAVAVTNVNEAPTGVADSVGTADNTAVTFNVLTNDVKVAATNSISVGSYTKPSNGTLVKNVDETFTYTPSATFLSGVDTFTYRPVEAGGELGAATTVTIQVNTVNSAPVVTAGQSFKVTENLNTAGQSVGFVKATDEEGGMPQNWTITAGNAAGNFAINSFTGEITTTNTANFNFETTPSYALSVTATDGTGLVSAAQTVTVNVTDVNEAPVVTSAATGTVAENATTSTVVYTAAASDVDAGDVMTYTLGGTDAAAFSINAATGVVTLKASADFETKAAYAIDVTATDKAGLSNTKAVAVTVTNVNEAPVVTSAATATVAEKAATSTVVYTATATDIDAGDTRSFSLGGTDAAAFNIDAATGVVTLKASADFETKAAYAIDVTATDKAGLTNTKAVAVTVTNVNEAPVVTSGATATVA
jgi:VCBS repeat-containing protein